VLARALVTLFFAWNDSQPFKNLEAKRNVMIHRVKATHPLLYQWLGRALTIVPSVFSVMAGLIVEMLFILFSVYNTVRWAESELI